MGWNEPKRDRDPWTDGSGRSPDLDELLHRLQKRFTRWFKRRPGPAPRRHSPLRWWGFAPIVVIIIWLATGFYQVPGGSEAVNLRFGVYTGLAGPGLHWHWPWPIAGVHVVNVSEQRSVSQRDQILTADGKLATIEITLNYRVADPFAYVFGTAQPVQMLNAFAADALARAARANSLAALTGNDQDKITAALKQRIGTALAALHAGVEVAGVNLRQVAVPGPVASARAQLAAVRTQAATAATAARSAASAELAKAQVRAGEIVAAAQRAQASRIAQVQEEVARFEALIPSWKKSPAATRALLREDVMTQILTATPKVVVAGPIHSVQIPGWPAPVAVSAGAPTTFAKPAKAANAASATRPGGEFR